MKPARSINGLVLIGGRSRRMGSDKAALRHHGIPEAERCAALLDDVCAAVYFSHRADQVAPGPGIVDPYLCGPLGGILAAMEAQPNAAWLVLACDLPNFGPAALEQLLAARDAGQEATVFQTDRLEPLAGIYEPAMLMPLRRAHEQGQLALRRVLERRQVRRVPAHDPAWLRNVNRPDDLACGDGNSDVRS